MKLVKSIVDPGHRLSVCVDVRGRHIGIRSDIIAKLGDKPASNAAQFVATQFLRITDDPALGATVGDIHDRSLPGHEGRKRGHLRLRHVWVVTDAALPGAAHLAVKDTESMKVLYRTIVHADREADVDRAFGIYQEVDNSILDPVDPDQGPFKLLGGVDEKIKTFRRSDRSIHRAPLWCTPFTLIF